MSQRRYFLTGAGGFVGGAIARALLARGDEVYAITRPGRHAPPGCKPVPVTAFLPDELRKLHLPGRLDGVVHLAAYGVAPNERDATEMATVNVACSQALVELARDHAVPRFVMAGTSAEYADHAIPPFNPSQPLQTHRLYGASKAEATLRCLSLASQHGIQAAVLRIYNVFGPGESSHRLFPSIVSGIRAGVPVRLSSGTQIRDFIYIEDVARAFLAALDLPRQPPQPVIDICTGRAATVRHFAETVARIMQADPDALEFGALPMRPDDIPEIRGDPAAMHDILGKIERFGLDEAIAHALERMSRTG
jgi:nucleoside-diphosphate-sugar epimerase